MILAKKPGMKMERKRSKRKVKPDVVGYLRLVMGIPMHLRILPTDKQDRLDLAVALIDFVTKYHPKQNTMAEFLRTYIQANGRSKSWAYDVLDQLKTIGIVNWDDYYREYHQNMNRWERDWERIRGFKAQIIYWERPEP